MEKLGRMALGREVGVGGGMKTLLMYVASSEGWRGWEVLLDRNFGLDIIM